MHNELLFIVHCVVVSGIVLGALAHSYEALLAVLGLQLIAANLFVTKQIALWGIATTAAEVFAVSGMLGMSLLQTYYGPQKARKTIVILFFFLLLFALFGWLQSLYEGAPNVLDVGVLLALAPRLFFASIMSYLLSERMHVVLLQRVFVRGSSPIMRLGIVALGQVVDTISFTVLGLWSVVDNPWSIIAASMAVKMSALALLSPLLSLVKWCVPLNRFSSEEQV